MDINADLRGNAPLPSPTASVTDAVGEGTEGSVPCQRLFGRRRGYD